MLNKLYLKRRVLIYLKIIGAISVIIFYFMLLLKESIHAYEVNKGGSIFLEQKPKVLAKNVHITVPKVQNFIIETTTTKEVTTINPIYEYSEELHSAIERQLTERRLHLLNVCSKENITDKYPPKPWEFFVSQGHNLVWCNVFKAASSTWMFYFNLLAGYSTNFLQKTVKTPLDLSRKHFQRPKIQELLNALSSSVSFITVREPFERLLSAYRDKLEGGNNKYYKRLGTFIAKEFPSDIKFKSHKSGPTFKQFLLYLIRCYKTDKPFDEHWAPIYSFCTPCSINYTIIAKVETFKRDSEFIIRQAGLESLLLGKLPHTKSKKITNASGDTRLLIDKYFSQLDRTTLDEILAIYRLDFDIFGYDYQKYYIIVEPPPASAISYLNSTSSMVF